MWVSNLVQNKNYRNSAEKPLQNTVKKTVKKQQEMSLQNLNKNYGETYKNMQTVCKTQLKMMSPY